MRLSIVLTVLAAVGLIMAGIQDAEAKRLGGGSSFGSKSPYSAPYKRPVAPKRDTGAAARPAQRQNAERQRQLASRGGLWGMLGGLALGGALGAMFFGGAFEGLNLLDIAIFGLVAFLGYKLFMRKSGAGLSGPRPAPASGASDPGYPPTDPEAPPAAATRDRGLDSPEMRRKFGSGDDDRSMNGRATALAPVSGVDDPFDGDFDQQAFLTGAERAFHMLQAAWDSGDLETLRGFTTEPVFRELERQFKARRGENKTLVLKLETQLLEVNRVDDGMEAAVMFDAILRETDEDTPADERGHRVREVWHFVRPATSEHPTWFLDGIQQVTE